MSRRRVRTAQQVGLAAAGVAALVAMSAAPGAAATTIAQASATAVQLTIGGQTMDTGSYQAVNDGSKESTSGSNMPAVTALGGQQLLTTGTLAQDAKTTVTDGKGSSVACSGLAGPGATAVGAGTPGSCLTGGQALTVNAANVDLSKLTIVQSGLFMGLDTTLQSQLSTALAPLTSALQTALQTALTQLKLGVNLNLGVVQSSCQAGPTSASGTANLTGAGASLQVGGQNVNLVNLPTNPAPNTHVVTGLGDVGKIVEDAVSAQLNTVLQNQLPTILQGLPLPSVPTISIADQATMLNNALAQLGTQLKPLQDNLIDATLNRQSQASPDQITVTALDLKLLPAAQQFGINAFELSVATSNCGPSGAVEVAAPSATPTQQASTKAKPKPKPSRQVKAVPTAIPAGLDSATATDGDAGHGVGGVLALGGLLAVAVGGAGAAWSGARKPR